MLHMLLTDSGSRGEDALDHVPRGELDSQNTALVPTHNTLIYLAYKASNWSSL